MAKQIDKNGFWLIEKNPITKTGVFPYLGCQIDKSGELGLDPNKIYSVYRPSDELKKPETIQSFNAVPFIDEHEMLGDGFTPYDQRPAGGILFNTEFDDQTGYLQGDFKIMSESLREEIEDGKKGLSLGYFCDYEPKRGTFRGAPYDFVQKNLVGNHVALVSKGRAGSDVRVYDSKTMVFDSICEVKPAIKGTDDMDKLQSIINSVLGVSATDEQIEAIKAQYAKDESEKEEKKEAEDECESGEKETEDEAEEKKDESKAEDESEEEKKDDAMDAMPKKVMEMIARRDALANQASEHIGTFDHAMMTEDEVAKYACKKIGLDTADSDPKALLKGYLAASKKTSKKSFTLDAAVKTSASKTQSELDRYLKGE